MTTPLHQNRAMKFDGPDAEFSKWGYSGSTLTFEIRACKRKLKLDWNGNEFTGPDPRGGFSTLSVPPFAVEEFNNATKGNNKLNYPKPQEIKKTSDIAIISEHQQFFGDTYVPDHEMKLMAAAVFAKGYKFLHVVDHTMNKTYQEVAENALDKLGCHFIAPEGKMSSKSVLDLHEIDTLTNFMMPVSTWLRIKGRVLNSKKNFISACQDAVKDLDLKIYAFSKSRISNNPPNEARLKNFKLNNEKPTE